jgi:hypothetical protein
MSANAVPRVPLLYRARLGCGRLFRLLFRVVGFRGMPLFVRGRRSRRCRGLRGRCLRGSRRLGIALSGERGTGNKREQRKRRDKRLHEGTPGFKITTPFFLALPGSAANNHRRISCGKCSGTKLSRFQSRQGGIIEETPAVRSAMRLCPTNRPAVRRKAIARALGHASEWVGRALKVGHRGAGAIDLCRIVACRWVAPHPCPQPVAPHEAADWQKTAAARPAAVGRGPHRGPRSFVT